MQYSCLVVVSTAAVVDTSDDRNLDRLVIELRAQQGVTEPDLKAVEGAQTGGCLKERLRRGLRAATAKRVGRIEQFALQDSEQRTLVRDGCGAYLSLKALDDTGMWGWEGGAGVVT